MRHLRAGDYRIMPWKNGAGSTSELAISPEYSGVSGNPFQWRVSIADVVANGPFSRFPGYDRHIMMIEGQGIALDIEGAREIDLSKPFRPASFSGDWNVQGKLIHGPVRDFNLIVQRSFARSALTVDEIATRKVLPLDGAIRIIHLLDGEVVTGGHVVAARETMVIDKDEAVDMKPLGPSAKLAICRIHPR
jgi:environmental stress-induced protein Ves